MKRLILTICLCVLFATGTTLAVPDGTFIVDGREIAFHKQGATVVLPDPGDYEWWYGCSPTSAGMMMGHYDVQGYNGQSYNNLVPGGDAENSTFGNPGALANNAIASSGHISDFYGGGYGASGDDVSPPWHEFDCLADFMGTSQDNLSTLFGGNVNGSTPFWYYTNGSPLYEADIYSAGPDYYNYSGMYGIGEYADYAGYDADVLYNQYIDTQGYTYGFTFAQYMAEIDAGRPVMIQVEDHSMYGYGYDSDTASVVLNDTWTAGPHSMTWGGAYYYPSGDRWLEHYGVTVLTPIPEPATIALLGLGSLSLLRRRRKA